MLDSMGRGAGGRTQVRPGRAVCRGDRGMGAKGERGQHASGGRSARSREEASRKGEAEARARHLIAVVDDHAPIRQAYKLLIQHAGYEVATFESADEFLSALKVRIPECLVLDVYMPGMSGLDLQDYLVKRGLRIPVIVVTGNHSPKVNERADDLGCTIYLRKPVDNHRLLHAIERAILLGAPSDRTGKP